MYKSISNMHKAHKCIVIDRDVTNRLQVLGPVGAAAVAGDDDASL